VLREGYGEVGRSWLSKLLISGSTISEITSFSKGNYGKYFLVGSFDEVRNVIGCRKQDPFLVNNGLFKIFVLPALKTL